MIRGLILLLTATSPAWSWGQAGHRIVAMIAEARLSPEARSRVSQLLMQGQYTMADVSACPDALRAFEKGNLRPEEQYCVTVAGSVPKESGPWHYIDIPLPAPSSHSLDAYCPNGNCVVEKIKFFTNILRDSTDETERRAALMYIIHFEGDIHQPLHCIERKCDQGGNLEHVNFYLKDQERVDHRLHGVWDSDLVDKSKADANIDEDRLYAASLLKGLNETEAAKWVQAPIEEVAWEGFAIAEHHAYRGIPDQNFCGVTERPAHPPITDLNSEYEKDGTSIVREQLLKAGVRLADLIEKNLTR
ncbi:MAG: S1/P1 nuclease [Bryobacteraceae bacterium]